MARSAGNKATMANRTLTADIIAAEALMILDNNLVMANLVHRAEDEFTTVNGYRVGDTINIRKPAQFEIREGAIAAPQDVVEGKMPLVVDTQAGVDFQFTSKDLTLNIKDLSPAGDEARDGSLGELRRSEVDGPLQAGPVSGSALLVRRSTPSLIFAVGIQRMDDKAIPTDDRCLRSVAR